MGGAGDAGDRRADLDCEQGRLGTTTTHDVPISADSCAPHPASQSLNASTPERTLPHDSRQSAPPPHSGAIATIAPSRGCGLCAGEGLVVVTHVPQCLASQWFDGREMWNCADVCARTDCPLCRPAAVGERSE